MFWISYFIPEKMQKEKIFIKNSYKRTFATWYFVAIKIKNQVGYLWQICPTAY